MATATTWFYTYCLPLPLHDALPNLTEPGLWLQYDFGDGPTISGRKTTLFCAWLAWSRFRVVIPIWDKTLPTVAACLDATFRRLGGVPVYVLTDNEKTATIDHVAGIAVRNTAIVEVARHYGTPMRRCLPADPESKGGRDRKSTRLNSSH